MFKVIVRVGALYGVVDTDDNVVEYLTKDVILDYIKQGVSIEGVNNGNISIVSYEAPWGLIPNKEGCNIFQMATNKVRKGNQVSFKSGSKNYKLRIIQESPTGATCQLNNGIFTFLPLNWFMS